MAWAVGRLSLLPFYLATEPPLSLSLQAGLTYCSSCFVVGFPGYLSLQLGLF